MGPQQLLYRPEHLINVYCYSGLAGNFVHMGFRWLSRVLAQCCTAPEHLVCTSVVSRRWLGPVGSGCKEEPTQQLELLSHSVGAGEFKTWLLSWFFRPSYLISRIRGADSVPGSIHRRYLQINPALSLVSCYFDTRHLQTNITPTDNSTGQ